MSIDKYLEAAPLHDLVRRAHAGGWSKEHVAFSGAARKHPYDAEKLILISDPVSTHATLYEFAVADVAHVEELPSLVTEDGEGITMVRLWVKKGALGIRYEPFIVEDTHRSMSARLRSGGAP